MRGVSLTSSGVSLSSEDLRAAGTELGALTAMEMTDMWQHLLGRRKVGAMIITTGKVRAAAGRA